MFVDPRPVKEIQVRGRRMYERRTWLRGGSETAGSEWGMETMCILVTCADDSGEEQL